MQFLVQQGFLVIYTITSTRIHSTSSSASALSRIYKTRISAKFWKYRHYVLPRQILVQQKIPDPLQVQTSLPSSWKCDTPCHSRLPSSLLVQEGSLLSSGSADTACHCVLPTQILVQQKIQSQRRFSGSTKPSSTGNLVLHLSPCDQEGS